MLNQSDYYYLRVYGKYKYLFLAGLLCLLVTSGIGFLFIFGILLVVCESLSRFLCLNASATTKKDTCLFLMTLPFSRKQLFSTYFKALTVQTSLIFVIYFMSLLLHASSATTFLNLPIILFALLSFYGGMIMLLNDYTDGRKEAPMFITIPAVLLFYLISWLFSISDKTELLLPVESIIIFILLCFNIFTVVNQKKKFLEVL